MKNMPFSPEQLKRRRAKKQLIADRYGITIDISEPYSDKCEMHECGADAHSILVGPDTFDSIYLCWTHHNVMKLAGLMEGDRFIILSRGRYKYS